MVLAAPNPESSLTILTPPDGQTGITITDWNLVGWALCVGGGGRDVSCFLALLMNSLTEAVFHRETAEQYKALAPDVFITNSPSPVRKGVGSNITLIIAFLTFV
jgi:hypothetical protein